MAIANKDRPRICSKPAWSTRQQTTLWAKVRLETLPAATAQHVASRWRLQQMESMFYNKKKISRTPYEWHVSQQLLIDYLWHTHAKLIFSSCLPSPNEGHTQQTQHTTTTHKSEGRNSGIFHMLTNNTVDGLPTVPSLLLLPFRLGFCYLNPNFQPRRRVNYSCPDVQRTSPPPSSNSHRSTT